MSGILGKKIGMTSVFDENGVCVPCTVIEAGPCYVTQIRTKEKDGYTAVQLGFDEKPERLVNKSLKGHFSKANTKMLRLLKEFRNVDSASLAIGAEVKVDVFAKGDKVSVTAKSKGKGFQGVVKRWGFGGGRATHGSKFHREPGSTGQSTYPHKTFKNVKLPGRMGRDKVTVLNLKLVKVDLEKGVVLIRGALPGPRNCDLLVRKAIKKN